MSVMKSKPICVLFLDERGCGPSECEIWLERHDPKAPELGDRLYFGLRLGNVGFDGESEDAGGYVLTEEDALKLYSDLDALLAKVAPQ